MQNIETLIKQAENIAKEKADGHLSMLKFTTEWKIFLGTPNLDIGEERERISELEAFPTLAEALASFVTEN